MPWTLTFVSLGIYIVGLIMLTRSSSSIVRRAFDEALFTAVSAIAILGAMLTFTAVAVTYFAWSGSFGARLLDIILLFILFIITIRTSFSTFRPRSGIGIGSYRISRVMAGIFYLLLSIAAVGVLVLVVKPT